MVWWVCVCKQPRGPGVTHWGLWRGPWRRWWRRLCWHKASRILRPVNTHSNKQPVLVFMEGVSNGYKHLHLDSYKWCKTIPITARRPEDAPSIFLNMYTVYIYSIIYIYNIYKMHKPAERWGFLLQEVAKQVPGHVFLTVCLCPPQQPLFVFCVLGTLCWMFYVLSAMCCLLSCIMCLCYDCVSPPPVIVYLLPCVGPSVS